MIRNNLFFRFFCLLLILCISGTTYFYLTSPIQPSTWSCQGTLDRDRICEFTNFCIDKTYGPFILSDTEPPEVNLLNVGPTEDLWFKPKVLSSIYRRAHYVNETLFVYGLYGPYHFSHLLFNGLIPLYSTIREYLPEKGPYSLLRARTVLDHYTPLDMNFMGLSQGQDRVLDHRNALSSLQSTPPFNPICFHRAVLGTGNRCSLWYCEREIAQEDYDAFITSVKETSLNPQDPCLNSVKKYGSKKTEATKIVILNRSHSRHITNMPEVIESMLKELKDISIDLISYDQGCDTKSTAHLVEKADVFISPHGNGLGSGLFMKRGSVVISIDSRWYSEDWFYWPMKALGMQMYSYACNNSACQEFDHELLDTLAPGLTSEQKEEIMTQEVTSVDRLLVEQYRKDSKRRIDTKRFIVFLKDTLSKSFSATF